MEDTADDDDNPFSNLKEKHLSALQDLVQKLGLNTEQGIEKLLSSDENDEHLIQQLILQLKISEDTVKTFLDDWRNSYNEVKRKKLKVKKKFKGMQPIWHCAVCGAGGLPQPVCYVAPYISEYQPIQN